MKRRRFLAGVAGLTVGSGAIVGSSAFSGVRADRTVTVGVARDAAAFLRLVALDGQGRAVQNNELLELRLPSDAYRRNSNVGVGTGSIYWFDGDGGRVRDRGVFRVANEGTMPVDVYAEHDASAGEPTLGIYDVDAGRTLLTENDPASTLAEGGRPLDVGLYVDARGASVREHDTSLTIIATATGEGER